MPQPFKAHVHSFRVVPSVPKPLAPLLEIAHNLWWSWHPEAVALYKRLDRDLWEECERNPVKMLRTLLLMIYKGWWFRYADTFVVEASISREGMATRIGISRDKTTVVPNSRAANKSIRNVEHDIFRLLVQRHEGKRVLLCLNCTLL